MWPTIPLLNIYLKTMKTVIEIKASTPMITAALHTIAKTQKTTWMSINGWIDKENVVWNGILFRQKWTKRFHFWQYGDSLRALCSVKWVRLRKIITVYILLIHGIFKRAHRYKEHISSWSRQGMASEWNGWKGSKGTNFQL